METPLVRYLWWGATALLVLAVIIDAIDGNLLKLATSVSLLSATAVGALTRSPRTMLARVVIGLGIGIATGLIIYRRMGPGL